MKPRQQPITLALTLTLLCGLGASLPAQEIRIAKQRGPYYVDEPMVIQVQVNGLKEGQKVECQLADTQLEGVTVEGPQIGQSTNSFTQIINGRISSSQTVNMKFNFTVTSPKAGETIIGPFTVDVDGKKQELEGIDVEFGQLEEDPDMHLEISLPRKKFFVGEKIPLTIRWLFAGDRGSLQYAFSNLQIRSPLFEQFDFEDAQPTTRTTLSIVTAQGVVEIDAEVSDVLRNGTEYVAVTGQRTLIAAHTGHVQAVRVTSRTQRVTAWGRDFFGERRPRDSRAALASSEPLSFEIVPIPTADRPEGFSGAVGSGFSIDVAANRSVVRVGDPISLDITLKGDGNVEQLSLPPLSKDLNPELFQLPAEIPSGTYTGSAKQFKVNVRVNDKSVSQLPALTFSWFDPQQEKFVTASSKPIALQVTDAQIVSSRDVVSGRPQMPTTLESPAENHQTSTGGISDQALDFIGANLAIEKNLQVLAATPRGWSERWLVPATYAAGCASILAAMLVRRRGRRSAGDQKQRSHIRQCLHEIRNSEQLSLKQAGQQIGDALRLLLPMVPDNKREGINSLIGECDNHVYAHTENPDPDVKRELIRRARAAVEELAGK